MAATSPQHRKSTTAHHAGTLHALLSSSSKDLADPSSSSAAYLASLSTQSLASLQSQPDLLSSSSTKITDQLAALCTRHIAPLVEVHRAERALPGAVGEISSTLDELINNALPALAQVTQSFEANTQAPLTARRKARTLIDAHRSQLQDVLNIPRLVATCVRAGHHDEALQLAGHIDQLASSQSSLGGGPTLQALRDEAWSSLHLMRDNLLESLSQRTLRLATARHIITHLRNLSQLGGPELALTEDELCVALLQSRSQVLHQSLASPIEAQRAAGRYSSPSQHIASAHLEAYIDVWKHGVQEAVSVTQGLFSDLPSLPSTLSAFIHLHIRLLRNEVARLLPQLLESLHQLCSTTPLDSSSRQVATTADETASALVALHTQLSFAASALREHGGDFTAVLAGTLPLDDAALDLLREPCTWSSQTLLRRHIPTSPTPPSTWLVKPQAASHLITAGVDLTSIDTALSPFPPLSAYLNNVLVGLNALSTFAPKHQCAFALAHLDASLTQVLTSLLEYAKQVPEQQSQSSIALPPLVDTPHRNGQAERLMAALSLEAYCSSLVPYLRRGLYVDVFGAGERTLSGFDDAHAMRWVNDVKRQWSEGEQERSNEVQERKRVAEEEQRRIAEEEAERKRIEEERRKAEEERRVEEERKRAEEQAERERIEQERKKAEEEAERRRVEEERQKAEEQERLRVEEQRRADEEAERKRTEEEARQKATEEAARQKAEEEARQKAEEEERRNLVEEEAARRKAAEDEARQKAEEEQRRKAEEAARQNAAAEEEERQRADAKARQQAVEAERKNAEAEEARQQSTKEEAKRKQADDEARQVTVDAEGSGKSQTEVVQAQTTAQKADEEQQSYVAPTPAPPTQTKKLSLAEKLKARQEERERLKRAAEVEVPSKSDVDGAGSGSAETAQSDTTAAAVVEGTPQDAPAQVTASADASAEPSGDEADGDGEADDGGDATNGNGDDTASPTPTKRKKNKKKGKKK